MASTSNQSSPWLLTRLYRYAFGPPSQLCPAKQEGALRIGIVGAANIAPPALVRAALPLPDVIAYGVTGT